jgi:hypothetical protein
MKKIYHLLAVAILTVSPIIATAQEPSAAPVGTGAMQSSQTGRTKNWQNWVFAGTALVTVAMGITFIVLNQGSHAH